MGLDVLFEGDSFDEFLNSAGDLSLVAPGVGAGELWSDGFEEVDDLGEACFVFFGDVGGRGALTVRTLIDILLTYGVLWYGVYYRLYRWRANILSKNRLVWQRRLDWWV